MTQQQRARRGRVILLCALAAGLAVVDQVTKYLAEAQLTPGVVVPLLGDFLGLQLVYNPGAAFSIATGMTWVFTVISLVVIVFVIRVARRLRSTIWAVTLGMLLGGALGNLYDRLLREPGFGRGHVVDFINYNGWFVGNIADIAIVGAAVLIGVLAVIGIEVDGTRVTKDEEGPADTAAEPADDVSEEPLSDEEDFSPDVPEASEDGLAVADWVRGEHPPPPHREAPPPPPHQEAPPPPPHRERTFSPAQSAGRSAGTTDPSAEPADRAAEPDDGPAEPAEPVAEPAEPVAEQAAKPEERTAPTPPDRTSPPAESTGRTPRRRPRSRREARLTGQAEDDA